MKLSLVVPCYNEEGNICAFIQKQSGYSMQKITSMKLFFVNDGSRDKTQEELGESI